MAESPERKANDLDAVARSIDRELPELARRVICHHLDVRTDDTRAFLTEPDAREQHQTEWHEWGIITHTRIFLRHVERDVPRYLRSWGVWDAVDAELSQQIDSSTRWELLRIAILLHDIGKFGARTRGRSRFHFGQHERLSGDIIRHEIDLAGYGLTSGQREYIARAAEDHFVLGLLRKRARERGEYDVGFTRSQEFEHLSERIKREHPDDYIEIGVLFLGDSMAKADPKTGPDRAVSQYEINIEVARRYLEVVLRTSAYNEGPGRD